MLQKIIFISIYIFVLLLFIVYSEFTLKKNENFMAQIETNNNEHLLNHFVNDKSRISKFIYEGIITNQQVIQCMIQANSKDDSIKDRARQNLYKLLKDEYKRYVHFHIQQLHFHLPNSESFLRFHQPDKYGDILKGIRLTVDYVNKELKPIIGFEEGRIFNGYRYVYPIIKNQVHLGSVEVSVSSQIIKTEYANNKNKTFDMIFKKEIIEYKVFNQFKSNYTKDPTFKGFLQLTSMFRHDLNHPLYKYKLILLNHLKNENIFNKLNKGKLFYETFFINNKAFVVSFVPIKNIISNITVGYIVTYFNSKILIIHKNNTRIYEITGLAILIILLFGLFREKRKDEKTKKELKYLNQSDMLTGIYNRQYFEEIAEELHKDYNVTNLCLILLDIDDFKKINDTLGHQIGDEAIKNLAQILISNTRNKEDTVARWGGEEFVLLIRENLDKSKIVAEKLRNEIENFKSDLYHSFTCSFGIVDLKKYNSLKEGFKIADDNLYKAKELGKNRVIST